jgi:hypothetical protein
LKCSRRAVDSKGIFPHDGFSVEPLDSLLSAHIEKGTVVKEISKKEQNLNMFTVK